jgi:hypothetical protein
LLEEVDIKITEIIKIITTTIIIIIIKIITIIIMVKGINIEIIRTMIVIDNKEISIKINKI